MTALHLRPASLDAVVAIYALIHLPLADRQALFPRIHNWLRRGGYLLAITGAERWTGTERYLGADMFWDHADTATYLHWLTAARLTPIWHHYPPRRIRAQPHPRPRLLTTARAAAGPDVHAERCRCIDIRPRPPTYSAVVRIVTAAPSS